MKNKKAVQLVGYKNSGKTHLMIRLCTLLKSMGVRVGCIKYSHHSLDRIDSDTDRLSKEADVVLGISPSSYEICYKGKKSFLDMLSYLDTDVILIEGGKHEIDFLPKVVVVKEDKDIELIDDLTIGVYPRKKDIILQREGVVVSEREDVLVEKILNRGYLLPGLDCGACGFESCRDMGVNILRGRKSVDSCITMNSRDIKVEVDGQPLNLNPFVQDIVKSTITGLLSNLKGYHKGEIKIKFKV